MAKTGRPTSDPVVCADHGAHLRAGARLPTCSSRQKEKVARDAAPQEQRTGGSRATHPNQLLHLQHYHKKHGGHFHGRFRRTQVSALKPLAQQTAKAARRWNQLDATVSKSMKQGIAARQTTDARPGLAAARMRKTSSHMLDAVVSPASKKLISTGAQPQCGPLVSMAILVGAGLGVALRLGKEVPTENGRPIG